MTQTACGDWHEEKHHTFANLESQQDVKAEVPMCHLTQTLRYNDPGLGTWEAHSPNLGIACLAATRPIGGIPHHSKETNYFA
jgi:hypothetical protein